MKTLKKTLCLVLAVVMVVGVLVIPANAADYSDADKISDDYSEAVEVMTAIGVFQGNGTGAFNPQKTLTREEAAKIICYMLLGETGAEALGTNQTIFKDVAAGRWSAGYIAYCVNQGILAGNGNGNFNPTGNLTGVAFGKMLLTALGYDAKTEGYVNSSTWSVNVAADMLSAGINVTGIHLDSPLTREQACQMAFQTLTADMVEYANPGIQIGDVTIATSPATPMAEPTTVTSYKGTVATPNYQFCERYFPKLLLKPDQNANATPGSQWVYADKEVAFAADDAVATYTSKVNASTVARDLRGYTYPANGAGVDYYEDGAKGTAPTSMTTEADSGGIEDLTGNGKVVSIYAKEDGTINTIVAVNTYIGRVTKVATVDNETVTTIAALVSGAPTAVTFKTDAFDKDDYVLYTVGDGDGNYDAKDTILTMKKIEGTVGKITATSTGYLRVDGTRMDYADKHNNTKAALGQAVIFTDSYGYVVYVGDVEAVDNTQYLYAQIADQYMGRNSIRAVFADGSIQVIEVGEDSDDGPLSGSVSNVKEKIYPYTEEDGVYTLDAALTDGDEEYAAGTKAGHAAITKGTNVIYVDYNGSSENNKFDSDEKIIATTNNATVFVVVDDGTVYTGYKNVPTMHADVKCVVKNGVATIVFIGDSDASADSADATYFFVADKAAWELVSTDAYAHTVYIDGEETQLTVTGDVHSTITGTGSEGLYKVKTLNNKGYVKELDSAFDSDGYKKLTDIKSEGIVATAIGDYTLVTRGMHNYTSKTYTYDDDTKFIYVGGKDVGVITDETVIVYTDEELKDDVINKIYVVPGNVDDANKAVYVYVIEDVEPTAVATLSANATATFTGSTITAISSVTLTTTQKDDVTIAVTGTGSASENDTITIKLVATDPGATLSTNTLTYKYESSNWTLQGGSPVTVTVTAKDGTTTDTYTFKTDANKLNFSN